MKRTQIILLLVIALMIGALLVTLEDASVYATFDIADKQTPETVTVVAKLDLENPIEFDPKTTLLTFKAIDKDGRSKNVIYNQPKPMDFERSEEITITGHSTSDYFVAEEILMKCPSKYIDEKGIDTSLIYSKNS